MSKLLYLMEINSWEHSRESWVLSLDRQEAATLNWLMIFVRLAKAQWQVDFENRPKQYDMFGREHSVFASSNYVMEFYDTYEVTDRYLILNCRERRLSTHAELTLDTKLSFARVKSAAITMRDKKENKIYRDFPSLFLKSKVKL